ncbi:MAG: acyl carrier protein [Ignavibacteria bacterium CG_4_8_14_3_um_filter_37_9]|nr:acyl carrier protein [Ignavibacteria bacterium]OIO23111.1 MAG: hypothetical protein AUJ54_02345 [Ignavibacteria bacterium CG1_02_37_35]PIS45923.1 MAG: acyl carrier protein [Ignavibacteria bacterium CG08_land_8_20_14_0_20_37_9]PIW98613.1 MAG: acyl carrier protein [Ignavibacteria bacterium CG_4_8_14_3_um_filter_37_9]PIX93750.1 MAG: acyl carrier protein [Ignavibacteria bacterium CG_4_10_14_3_um_filter_37_18]
MDVQEFIEKIETSLDGLTPGTITPETEFRSLEMWDSLADLTLLAMVDAEYDVAISGGELRNFNTIQDIINFIIVHKK